MTDSRRRISIKCAYVQKPATQGEPLVKEVIFTLFDLQCDKNKFWTCAPSENSDQTAQMRSLIGVFTVRSLDSQVFKV